MKRKGKRFLVLLTTASLSLNMLGISKRPLIFERASVCQKVLF